MGSGGIRKLAVLHTAKKNKKTKRGEGRGGVWSDLVVLLVLLLLSRRRGPHASG